MNRNSPTPAKKEMRRQLPTDNQLTINKQKQEYLNSKSKQILKKKPVETIKQFDFRQLNHAQHEAENRQKKLIRNKSTNIIKHLDQRDATFIHKYKQLKNHNKHSDFDEVKNIIEQFLNKHAQNRSLSISQQYILTGYMGKYAQMIKKIEKTIVNPFNITQRLETKNSFHCTQKVEERRLLSPRKGNSSITKRRGKVATEVEERKNLLSKQLQRLKFLWQMYQLKCMICPDISKISEFRESDSHREMMELMIKLKSIERNREKVGEEKSLMEVQKVMKIFDETIKKCLF